MWVEKHWELSIVVWNNLDLSSQTIRYKQSLQQVLCVVHTASPSILQTMVQRASEYTRPQSLRVSVATYNVNGGKHFRSILCKNVSLADWLLDAHKTHPGEKYILIFGRFLEEGIFRFKLRKTVADQTFYLTQSQYTDTGRTSPSADPIMPGAWQGSHGSADFEVTGMTRPRKIPGASGIRTQDLSLSRRTP